VPITNEITNIAIHLKEKKKASANDPVVNLFYYILIVDHAL